MQWNDEAIVLSARKFGERDLIITVFAKEEGIYGGIVKAGQAKSKLPDYQPGNIIEATWRARLSDQLGTITAELKKPITAMLLHDSLKLQAMLAANALLKSCLAEREKDGVLYDKYFTLLTDLATNQNWQRDYVVFEIELLKHTGFGLDLAVCAVTGRADNLVFVSPRTGRAVSREGAAGYESKLLRLPAFIFADNFAENEIVEGLALTEYFFSKEIFLPQNKKFPAERLRLAEMLSRKLRAA